MGKMNKSKTKIHRVMSEFKQGELHSGSPAGPKVKSRAQAVVIAMSEAGMSRKKMRKHNPAPPYGKAGCFKAAGKIGIR